MDNINSKKNIDSATKSENASKHSKPSTENIKEKGLKAAVSYINKKGYDVLDTNYECEFGKMDVIAKQDDVLIFADVDVLGKDVTGFPSENYDKDTRFKIECIMAKYLQDHDYIDMQVRFDAMKLLVLGESKAFVRYHVNALGVSGEDRNVIEKQPTKDRVTQRAKSASKVDKNKNEAVKQINNPEK